VTPDATPVSASIPTDATTRPIPIDVSQVVGVRNEPRAANPDRFPEPKVPPVAVRKNAKPKIDRPVRHVFRAVKRKPAHKAPSANRRAIIRYAATFKGIDYVWGGNTPFSGFDCSGYTKYVFKHFGITLPRTSYLQADYARRVSEAARLPGDLVFFASNGVVHHVGIYAGYGKMWNSPNSDGSVRLEKIWRNQGAVSYGRVL
jgi:cell wall-associated NlpC family hydrolase